MCRKERLVTSLGHLSLEDDCGSNSNNKKIQKMHMKRHLYFCQYMVCAGIFLWPCCFC